MKTEDKDIIARGVRRLTMIGLAALSALGVMLGCWLGLVWALGIDNGSLAFLHLALFLGFTAASVALAVAVVKPLWDDRYGGIDWDDVMIPCGMFLLLFVPFALTFGTLFVLTVLGMVTT